MTTYKTKKGLRALATAACLAAVVSANELYSAAEAMNNRRRSDRAQKLLDLATAQANLAEATSEAALAEQSLGYIHIRQPR